MEQEELTSVTTTIQPEKPIMRKPRKITLSELANEFEGNRLNRRNQARRYKRLVGSRRLLTNK